MAGPGSPSYALRQWAGGPIPDALATKLRDGGIVTMASAAALTRRRRDDPGLRGLQGRRGAALARRARPPGPRRRACARPSSPTTTTPRAAPTTPASATWASGACGCWRRPCPPAPSSWASTATRRSCSTSEAGTAAVSGLGGATVRVGRPERRLRGAGREVAHRGAGRGGPGAGRRRDGRRRARVLRPGAAGFGGRPAGAALGPAARRDGRAGGNVRRGAGPRRHPGRRRGAPRPGLRDQRARPPRRGQPGPRQCRCHVPGSHRPPGRTGGDGDARPAGDAGAVRRGPAGASRARPRRPRLGRPPTSSATGWPRPASRSGMGRTVPTWVLERRRRADPGHRAAPRGACRVPEAGDERERQPAGSPPGGGGGWPARAPARGTRRRARSPAARRTR